MSNQKFTRKDDQDPSLATHKNYNSTGLKGTWYNCDPSSAQIIQLEVLQEREVLYMKAQGSHQPEPIVWERKAIQPFVAIPDANTIGGFTCHYDFGFMETQICSNIKRGVLVIQAYNVFKDDSGRPNYYSREFFNK